MKTNIMLILVFQLMATTKIFIVYFGLYELASYFNFMNGITLIPYAIISIVAVIIFLNGERNKLGAESNGIAR
jgi:hypothetical protein